MTLKKLLNEALYGTPYVSDKRKKQLEALETLKRAKRRKEQEKRRKREFDRQMYAMYGKDR